MTKTQGQRKITALSNRTGRGYTGLNNNTTPRSRRHYEEKARGFAAMSPKKQREIASLGGAHSITARAVLRR